MHHSKSVASISAIGCLQGEYWKLTQFTNFRKHVEELAGALAQYSDYPISQNKQMKEVHSSEHPVHQLSDSLSVETVKKSTVSYPCFSNLCERLNGLEPYQRICLTDFCPEESRHRYEYIQKLKRGLNVPVVIVIFSQGTIAGIYTSFGSVVLMI